MAKPTMFPAIDKKLTKGLSPVNFVLQDEGDELKGTYAGSAPHTLDSGKTVQMHYFVTDEGVARVMQRKAIDSFLVKNKVRPGTDVEIKRGKERTFKANGERRTFIEFSCELA